MSRRDDHRWWSHRDTDEIFGDGWVWDRVSGRIWGQRLLSLFEGYWADQAVMPTMRMTSTFAKGRSAYWG